MLDVGPVSNEEEGCILWKLSRYQLYIGQKERGHLPVWRAGTTFYAKRPNHVLLDYKGYLERKLPEGSD